MLRKGTMAGNLAKAKGASPELREALVRFYGEKRVNAAGGSAATAKKVVPSSATRADKTPIKKSYVQTPKKNQSGNGSGKPMAVQKPSEKKNIPTMSAGATRGTALAVGLGATAAAAKNKARTSNIARNTAKANNPDFSATKRNLAAMKAGKARGLATKGEVKEARAASKTVTKRAVVRANAVNKMKAQGVKATSTVTGRAMQFRKK